MNIVYIYGLFHPDHPHEIRYIGKTINSIQQRLKYHLCPKNLKANTHKNNWIKSIIRDEKKPGIKLLDITDESNWINLEKFYIASYKLAGFNLTNGTAGGEGMLGHIRSREANNKAALKLKGRSLSLETKNKISLAKKGKSRKPQSPEVIAKIAAANRGKKRSLEIKQLLSNSHKGSKLSEETKRKISESCKGRIHSPEAISKIALANTGLKKSPITKEKIRIARLGKKQSPEHIAKRLASIKLRALASQLKKDVQQ